MRRERYSDNNLSSMGGDGFDDVPSKLDQTAMLRHLPANDNVGRMRKSEAGRVDHLNASATPVKKAMQRTFICSCNHGNGKDCESHDGTCSCCGGVVSAVKTSTNTGADGFQNAAGGSASWDKTLIVQKYQGLLHSVEALKTGLNTLNLAASKAAIQDVLKYVNDLDKVIG